MEVLDPAASESYIPENRLGTIVAAMLESPMLESLEADFINRRLDRALAVEVIGNHEINTARSIFILQSISLRCFVEILEGDIAMSEDQIAGEICRVNRVLQAVGSLCGLTDIVRTDDCDIEVNMAKNPRGNFWIPPGTQLPCPTIDGRSSHTQRLTFDPIDWMRGRPSFHRLWRSNLSAWLRDQVDGGAVRILEPPFRLTSGQLMEDGDPSFFALIKGTGIDVLIPGPGTAPSELISI